jgi:hypothetical protein
MTDPRLSDGQWRELLAARLRHPDAVAEALARRPRRPLLGPDGHLFLVAADHGARGMLGVGANPLAMANRRDLLSRIVTALDHPRVDGVMASPDIVDDLALLGAIDHKIVIGTMNRGGLGGAAWELDDPMTAYDAEAIERDGLDGGKMLLRIDLDQPGTLPTLTAVANGVSALARRRLLAMVEPLPYRTGEGARPALVKDPVALTRCIAVASALGDTSAYTWLKLPAWDGIEEFMAATSMPTLLLGGEPSADPEADRQAWARALAVPHVRGYVIGRALLYPSDGDVTTAIATAAALLDAAIAAKED